MTRSNRSRPQVVVVTGASAGLGRAIVHAFADRGDRVALLARNRTGLEAAAEEVRARGGTALVVEVDVADDGQVESAAQRVEQELGPIDVWVNNAMAAVFSPFLEVSPEEYRRGVEVTFLGSVNGARAALRRMTERDTGHLIQIGSSLAFRGIPLQSVYCASKHALNGLYDSLRAELLHDGSRVQITSVHMPAMNTPQFRLGLAKMPHKAQPVPPIYQPEVAARAVVWASEHRRREVWVGASTVATILGSRVAGGLLDHYLGRTGYSSQQTDEPADPDSPNYLFSPVPGDHGTHGPFDDQAHTRSVQLPVSLHRGAVLTGLTALGAAAVGLARRHR
ncbi:SDR family oxidoreductase [Modestobacter sp. KNN46-3]|jgi:NAD(P)-dependent dehydrogenase (short-subunit alcohol dehydrogenase family)|uniref:SDR family oxidoreductase n=1 Tax=Modestobacter sp. KNN46-3 TaxID=2711218 RepID=UPI0013DFD0BF|nr:SDR family oxidoreductase [Modestobacter sp. KNN46-3]